ncbi:lipoyl(octanoyl) transferase [Fusarium phyllophilum]|uniref:Lipoyl(Octanoyl) transferase n=1 Tax=Fusarium phyllophilum TaxID=47803 RepID=A0A8H5JA09_9HYPO|nr:lipoyl(octanoyl) transferase [Fusarium phyllophilum]
MPLGLRLKAIPSSAIESTSFRIGAGTSAGHVFVNRWSSTYTTPTSEAPPPKLLVHRHLTGSGPDAFVPYDTANNEQEELRSLFLGWKSLSEEQQQDRGHIPRPHLLSFEPTPTLTLGRRQRPLTPEQTSYFKSPLYVSLPHRRNPVKEQSFIPEVKQTSRGGLTTYHGPGQLVLWPVLDMHSPLYAHYSVMSYADHLEATTRRLLARLFDLETYTTRDEPGVWVRTPAGQPERKIAAIGVHHRRHVTALGIAINIDVSVDGPDVVNPWARFVPCGLEGKLVTSVAAELAMKDGIARLGGWNTASLAAVWAKIFEEGIVDVTKRSIDGEGSSQFRRAVS